MGPVLVQEETIPPPPPHLPPDGKRLQIKKNDHKVEASRLKTVDQWRAVCRLVKWSIPGKNRFRPQMNLQCNGST